MQGTTSVLERLSSGKGWISVYGIGYVGLSLVAVFLRKGFKVIGIDISQERIRDVMEGRLWFNESEIKEAISSGLRNGKLRLTSDGEVASRKSLVKVITVPVKVDWLSKTFSLKPIEEVGKTIGKGLKPGDLVLLESSVPPGTTEFVLQPILESVSGLKAGKDFFLAYSPERVYIGRAVKDIEVNYPKVVGGVGRKSLEIAAEFYSNIASKGVIKLSSPRAAEFEKLAEGVYRDVNIALANELALASMRLGVDFFEVREAANSQPYSHIHLPGPGVGGYCIPLYPYFLAKALLDKGYIMELTFLARRINEGMPYEVVKLVEALRVKLGLSPLGIRVALLGVAFRGDIDDSRLSPSHDIAGLLKARGYSNIIAHDPYVRKDRIMEGLRIPLTSDLSEALQGADIVVIATKHRMYRDLSVSRILDLSMKETVIVDAVNAITIDKEYDKIIVLGKHKYPQ